MHRFQFLTLLLLAILLLWNPILSSAHRMHHSMPMMDGKKLSEAARRAGNPVEADAASLKRGAAIFKTYCAACHGEDGAGDGPAAAGLAAKPASLILLAGRVPDKRFADHIKVGGAVMPPFQNLLKENQIWDVTNFLQSLAN